MFRRSDAIARGAVAGSGHARRAAAVSTGCGPISSSTLQFRSARVRTLLANSHRLARVPTPVGAVEFHAPAERGAGAVVDQNPLWRA